MGYVPSIDPIGCFGDLFSCQVNNVRGTDVKPETINRLFCVVDHFGAPIEWTRYNQPKLF